MAARDVSCVPAIHKGKAAGVLTMTYILKRTVAVMKSPIYVIVEEAKSFPLISIGSESSISSAGRLMDRGRVHRLVVTGDDRMWGIGSQTEVLNAIGPVMFDS